MPSNMFLRKSIFIIISILVLLSISVTVIATEQATEPVDTSAEAITTNEPEVNPTDETENDDDNKGKEEAQNRMNALVIALIGFVGGVFASIFAGIVQMMVTKKTINNSKEQFKLQMDHAERELSIQLEQIRNEQMRYAHEKEEAAIKMLMSEGDLVRKNLEKRIEFYTQTLHVELKRIEALSDPGREKEREQYKLYNPISSCLSSMDFGCELHGKVSSNIGLLLSYIDKYNSSIKDIHSIDAIDYLEDLLNKIFITARTIEDDIIYLCGEDQNSLREYIRASAESLLENAKRLKPQANNDFEENNKAE